MKARTPESGWYPDPRGVAGSYRWWDGADWTAALSTDPAAPAPDPSPVSPPAPAALPAQPAQPAPPPTRLDPARTSAYAVRPRDPSRPRTRPDLIAAGLAVVALLVAVSVVVLVRSDGSSAGAAPLDPPAPIPTTGSLVYDPSLRRAVSSGVAATLPVQPWSAAALDSGQPAGLFVDAVAAELAVPSTSGAAGTARILFGAPDPALVADDATATARAVLQRVADTYYGPGPVLGTPSVATDELQDRTLVLLKATVRSGQGSDRTDKIDLLLVGSAPGSDDPPAVWVAARSERSAAAVAEAVQASYSSLAFA